MKYISTRGDMTEYEPSAALIKGLADDGGLFVPKSFPKPFNDLDKLSGLEYNELAYEITSLFFADFTEEELKSCIESAYSAEKFDDSQIAPLVKAGGVYFLELFHGRTLAFKDMALSLHPYLMKLAAKKQGIDKHILILTATSGDTGKAAMEGFRDVDGVSVIVFYPKDGVSKVQELQMTTQEGGNATACAVAGNFDDAQTAVKSIFSDRQLKKEFDEAGVILSSANSINIGRLVPQVVYYFYAYFQLAAGGEIKLGEQINFCVPTGNFGNILAAYYAKMLGLPVKKLLCASNENKVLCDFFETGEYDRNRELFVTSSPSMDILVSSNLERLLCHLSGKPANDMMEALAANGKYRFDKSLLEREGFIGGFASESECAEAISELYEDTGYIMDTHTAVAYHAYSEYKGKTSDDTKTVITATASPFKFAKSVLSAIDKSYARADDFELLRILAEMLAQDVPAQIDGLNEKKVLHSHFCDKSSIKEFVKQCLTDRLQ